MVVIAARSELRRRIATTLAEEGLAVAIKSDLDGAVAKPVAGAAAFVLACDVDAPRQIAALRRLRKQARQPGIVVVSPTATGTGVRRALDAGADAIVFEPELERTLPTAALGVASGQSVVPREFRTSIERPALSYRENQVLGLIRQGLTNAEIAERLFLAESTIKSHVSSIFGKFGVRSRKEVAAVLAELERAPDPAAEAAPGAGA